MAKTLYSTPAEAESAIATDKLGVQAAAAQHRAKLAKRVGDMTAKLEELERELNLWSEVFNKTV